jgi:Protein of unknown function (DUF3303)
MVVERFRNGDWSAVGERFRRKGRMMSEGVMYVDSWMARSGDRCYQIMDAPNRAGIDEWISHWSDLVDFEVTEIEASAEFWSRVGTA